MLAALPDVTQVKICSYLDAQDLAHISMTSRSLRNAAFQAGIEKKAFVSWPIIQADLHQYDIYNIPKTEAQLFRLYKSVQIVDLTGAEHPEKLLRYARALPKKPTIYGVKHSLCPETALLEEYVRKLGGDSSAEALARQLYDKKEEEWVEPFLDAFLPALDTVRSTLEREYFSPVYSREGSIFTVPLDLLRLLVSNSLGILAHYYVEKLTTLTVEESNRLDGYIYAMLCPQTNQDPIWGQKHRYDSYYALLAALEILCYTPEQMATFNHHFSHIACVGYDRFKFAILLTRLNANDLTELDQVLSGDLYSDLVALKFALDSWRLNQSQRQEFKELASAIDKEHHAALLKFVRLSKGQKGQVKHLIQCKDPLSRKTICPETLPFFIEALAVVENESERV